MYTTHELIESLAQSIDDLTTTVERQQAIIDRLVQATGVQIDDGDL